MSDDIRSSQYSRDSMIHSVWAHQLRFEREAATFRAEAPQWQHRVLIPPHERESPPLHPRAENLPRLEREFTAAALAKITTTHLIPLLCVGDAGWHGQQGAGASSSSETSDMTCFPIYCWSYPKWSAECSNKAAESIAHHLRWQYRMWNVKPELAGRDLVNPAPEDCRDVLKACRREATYVCAAGPSTGGGGGGAQGGQTQNTITIYNRIMVHYYGHGTRKPENGNMYLYSSRGSGSSSSSAQSTSVAFEDVRRALGSPSLYILDSDNAGSLLRHTLPDGRALETIDSGDIIFAACREGEAIPSSAFFPSDVFSSCMTTPVQAAVLWHTTQLVNLVEAPLEITHLLSGSVADRRTPLGEVNWTLMTITDSIAWTCLPPTVFYRLLRTDLALAVVCRNYLLASRIMRSFGCHTVAHPNVFPDTSRHPLWATWDQYLDGVVHALVVQSSDFPSLRSIRHQIRRVRVSLLRAHVPRSISIPTTTFFRDALQACGVWLEQARAVYTNSASAALLQQQQQSPKQQPLAPPSAETAFALHVNPSTSNGSFGVEAAAIGGANLAPFSGQCTTPFFAGNAMFHALNGTSLNSPTHNSNNGSSVFNQTMAQVQQEGERIEFLPLLLQTMLLPEYRTETMPLICGCADLGPWAISQMFQVILHGFILKLLSRNPSLPLAPFAAFIWAKFIAFDVDYVVEEAQRQKWCIEFYATPMERPTADPTGALGYYSTDEGQLLIYCCSLTVLAVRRAGGTTAFWTHIRHLVAKTLKTRTLSTRARQYHILCLGSTYLNPAMYTHTQDIEYEPILTCFKDPCEEVRIAAMASIRLLLLFLSNHMEDAAVAHIVETIYIQITEHVLVEASVSVRLQCTHLLSLYLTLRARTYRTRNIDTLCPHILNVGRSPSLAPSQPTISMSHAASDETAANTTAAFPHPHPNEGAGISPPNTANAGGRDSRHVRHETSLPLNTASMSNGPTVAASSTSTDMPSHNQTLSPSSSAQVHNNQQQQNNAQQQQQQQQSSVDASIKVLECLVSLCSDPAAPIFTKALHIQQFFLVRVLGRATCTTPMHMRLNNNARPLGTFERMFLKAREPSTPHHRHSVAAAHPPPPASPSLVPSSIVLFQMQSLSRNPIEETTTSLYDASPAGGAPPISLPPAFGGDLNPTSSIGSVTSPTVTPSSPAGSAFVEDKEIVDTFFELPVLSLLRSHLLEDKTSSMDDVAVDLRHRADLEHVTRMQISNCHDVLDAKAAFVKFGQEPMATFALPSVSEHITFHPFHPWVLATSGPDVVVLVDWDSGAVISTLNCCGSQQRYETSSSLGFSSADSRSRITQLHFVDPGYDSLVLTSSSSGVVSVFDKVTVNGGATMVSTFRGIPNRDVGYHYDDCSTAWCQPTGMLGCSSVGSSLYLWDLQKQLCTQECVDHTHAAHTHSKTMCLEGSTPMPQLFAAGCANGAVFIYDTRETSGPCHRVQCHDGSCVNLSFPCYDSNAMFTVSAHGLLHEWDMRSLHDPISSIALSSASLHKTKKRFSENFFVSASMHRYTSTVAGVMNSGDVRLYGHDGVRLDRMTVVDRPRAITWHPTRPLVAMGTETSTILVYGLVDEATVDILDIWR
eukprot:PhM_4_TR13357/c0_g1_i1/m.92077/K07204/RAPTOR; regulatory associated protein of mTOR